MEETRFPNTDYLVIFILDNSHFAIIFYRLFFYVNRKTFFRNLFWVSIK